MKTFFTIGTIITLMIGAALPSFAQLVPPNGGSPKTTTGAATK